MVVISHIIHVTRPYLCNQSLLLSSVTTDLPITPSAHLFCLVHAINIILIIFLFNLSIFRLFLFLLCFCECYIIVMNITHPMGQSSAGLAIRQNKHVAGASMEEIVNSLQHEINHFELAKIIFPKCFYG